MAVEYKFGLMGQGTMDFGKTEQELGMEGLLISNKMMIMNKHLKVFLKDNLLMINIMVMELKNGRMVQYTMVNIEIIKNTVMVNYYFLMVVSTMEIFIITKFMASVSTNGMMEDVTKVNSIVVKWKEMVNLNGQMDINIQVNIKMIKNTATA